MTSMGNDEQVVPAHGQIIDFNKVGEEDFGMEEQKEQVEDEVANMKVQNIPQSQRPFAEMLVPMYGEQVPCLMYAAKWKHRESGVTQFYQGMQEAIKTAINNVDVNESMGGLTKDQKVNQAILLNMTEVLKDKVQQIVNKCLPMVENYQKILKEMAQLNPRQDNSIFERFLM